MHWLLIPYVYLIKYLQNKASYYKGNDSQLAYEKKDVLAQHTNLQRSIEYLYQRDIKTWFKHKNIHII